MCGNFNPFTTNGLIWVVLFQIGQIKKLGIKIQPRPTTNSVKSYPIIRSCWSRTSFINNLQAFMSFKTTSNSEKERFLDHQQNQQEGSRAGMELSRKKKRKEFCILV